MDRRHIRYLIALADELSFSRAALRVGIAQPPFSKQIQDLEREIGTALVRRTTRDVSLTPAGAAFVERARSLERQLAHAVDEARRIGAGQLGRLRVGYTESAIFHPDLVRMFQEFRLAHPDVDLMLDEQVSTTQLEMLRAGELDVAFIRPPLPSDPDFDCMPLLREPMAVALPKGHRLADRKTVQLGQLDRDNFIFFPRRTRPGLTGTVILACEQEGFTPRAGQAAPQVTSAMRLVAAGAGIAVVPASMASMKMDGVVVRSLDHPWLCAEVALAMRRDDISVLSSSLRATALRICGEGLPTLPS